MTLSFGRRLQTLGLGLLLSWLFVFFVANGLLADWPGWRGPAGVGVSPAKDLPIRWSATENVRWKVPLPGAGVSTPVVSGDQVFLTASDEQWPVRMPVGKPKDARR